MKPLPIRVKLTAWYFGVLAVSFSLFGAIAFVAMQKSIETTVDEDLRDRVEGIHQLMEHVLPEGQERLKDELSEHSDLRAGGELLQVSDEQNHWLYRSASMSRYEVPMLMDGKTRIATREFKGLPFRVLTAGVRVGTQTYRVQVAAPMDDFYDAMNYFKWALLSSSPVLLLLASLGGYWMSRRALIPVDEITKAAQSISSQNLSSRLAVPQSRDELQRLSETLNGMLARLEAAFRRITQFTADASHELRTPVALMRTTAELSLRKPREESEYREALAQILKELEKTSALIEKLMLLARADSGVETLRRTPVNLVDIVREACKEGNKLAEAKQIEFREQLGSSPLFVEADFQLLQRLFLILIDNAVKYTPSRGRVIVSVSSNNGFAVTEVHDTGIGIPETDLPHIFERFYRADKARSRDSGGVGLGLSIGRWIAEAHGGVIEVQSAPGKGSAFQVRLPLTAPTPQGRSRVSTAEGQSNGGGA